jgi:hypothetical protein
VAEAASNFLGRCVSVRTVLERERKIGILRILRSQMASGAAVHPVQPLHNDLPDFETFGSNLVFLLECGGKLIAMLLNFFW